MPKHPPVFPKTIQAEITAQLEKKHREGMPLTQKQPDGRYAKIYPDGRREVLDMTSRRAAIAGLRSE